MKSTFKVFVKIGFLLCGISVIMGAFGSHLLKDLIGLNELNIYETGLKYQFTHSLAILFLALNHRKLNQKSLLISLWFLLVGIIIFSGSLYLLSTRAIWGNDDHKFLGAITPIGGVAFILGWFLLFFKGFSKENALTNPETEKKTSRRHHRKHSQKMPDDNINNI